MGEQDGPSADQHTTEMSLWGFQQDEKPLPQQTGTTCTAKIVDL
jgi:hypothetical protein